MERDTVFVVGGTGFIGGEVLNVLREARPDLQVLALVRDERSAAVVRAAGATPVMGALTVPGPWQAEARGARYLVHAAQPRPFGQRLTTAVAKRLERDRLAMDRQLLDSLDSTADQRVVYVSGHSYFGDTREVGVGDEGMPRRPSGFGPFIERAVDALDVYRDRGMDLVTVFPGSVYGHGSWFEDFALAPLRTGATIYAMRGEAPLASPIHVVDCARAIVFLLGVPEARLTAGRRFLVVDDEPMSIPALQTLAADAMGRPLKVRQVPGFMVRLFAGAVGYSYLTSHCVYSNARLRSLGFELLFPTARSGVPDVVRRAGLGRA